MISSRVMRVGGRGQRDARHVRKPLVQHRQLNVFGPEIVPPLRHAMRFVDGEQARSRARSSKSKKRGVINRSGATYSRSISPSRNARSVARRFGARQRRVQIRGPHADFRERGDLILHQRDQRRHDDPAPKPPRAHSDGI